ncbi:uncharacterized protein LOC117641892 [Thrips palmi]|uniref:Uncharacterized protein LOC117641892 n=1 Tax=Thrips palmi TaxID=161013 RepID=A0A6P8ZJL2_THRPL|nr:uncharacterized protein LOC117641892 [Thrips palmi]
MSGHAMHADTPAPLGVLLLCLGCAVGLGVGLGHRDREVGAVSLRQAPVPTPNRQAPPIGDVPDVRKRPSRPSFLSSRLVAEIPFLRECQDVPTNSIKYFNMTTRLVGKADFFLNGAYEISRLAKDLSEIVIILTKCKEIVSANTCEHFQTWRFKKNICQNIFFGNQIWAKFNENIIPTPKCPAAPGTYQIRNATIDINVLQTLPMPLEGHVYRARHFMMEPNGVPHICSEAEIQFHRSRN